MKKQISESKVTPSGYISVAWPPFAQKLATVLERLDEDQFLILSVKRSNRFIQFAAQGAFGIRIETTSNSYLEKPEQLDTCQIVTLIGDGWHVPTGIPADSTPEDDPDGSPNFYVEFPHPVSFDVVANLTVRTLAEILRVPHPASLQYEAFNENGQAIELPELGLKPGTRAPQAETKEDLSRLLRTTLRETTGISEIKFDDDGDIGFHFGSALTFVRFIDDRTYVRIYSLILRDVEASPDIFARLNDLNANETLVRFAFRNGVIYGVADISAVPFVSAHVDQAFLHFYTIVDGMDSLLQEEFGGVTAYVESIPSSVRH
jgi:hypothetical protein